MVVIQNGMVLSRPSICNRLAMAIINTSASSQKGAITVQFQINFRKLIKISKIP